MLEQGRAPPPLTKRWFYPGQASKGNPGGKRERKIRGRSGVEELVDSSGP